MSDYDYRFSGIARLYGKQGLERLRNSHVSVVGIGGVGSWIAEALARSGIGTISLVDMDDVCLSNVNRQLPALDGTIGRAKTDVIAERIRLINPECDVRNIHAFFTAKTAEKLITPDLSYVVDAIDSVRNKALMIAWCRAIGVPIVTMGGAGGRRDPSFIQVADITKARDDRLLALVRKKLRTDYEFPRGSRWRYKVEAVFSTEPVLYPQSDGSVCPAREAGSELRLDCESGYGTATFVTGAFGFTAASRVVTHLALDTAEKSDLPFLKERFERATVS